MQAVYDDEPSGEAAADLRAAKLATVVNPEVDAEAFLKTPGDLRRERDAEAGPTAEATDAMFAALMGRQALAEARQAAKGKG